MLLATALLTLVTGLIARPTLADDTPGTFVTLTSGGTLARDLFTVEADGKTLTVRGDHTENSKWFFSGNLTGQLVGISKIFMVDVSAGANHPSPGPSTTANGGFVKTSEFSGTTTAWLTDTSNNYPRYTDRANGGGFSTNDHWLTVGNPATANKSGTAIDDFGSFMFATPLLTPAGSLKYAIGVDYLLANGATGRAYFLGDGTTHIVPEPAFYQMAALVGLGGLGLRRLRRRPNA